MIKNQDLNHNMLQRMRKKDEVDVRPQYLFIFLKFTFLEEYIVVKKCSFVIKLMVRTTHSILYSHMRNSG
jgi:hypothetical protein